MAWLSTKWTGARSAGAPRVRPGGHGGGSPARHPEADVAELAPRNVAALEYLAGGRLRMAVPALESLLNDCRRRLGEGHPETLVVEGNLAVTYVMIGQDEDGARLMLANLGGRERVFGNDHPLTLTARDALATTYRLAGRLSEAMRLYSQVAPQRNRVLGPSHPDTLMTRLGLGLTLADAGNTALACDVVAAALRDCEKVGVAGEHAAVLRLCLSQLLRSGSADEPETGPAADGAADRTVDGMSVPQPRSTSTPGPDEPLPLQRDREQPLPVGIGPGRGRDGLT